MTAVEQRVVLEPAAQDLTEATADPRGLVDLGPEGARKVLDDLQAAPVDKLPVDEEWVTVPAAVGDVRVRIVRPRDAASVLPVVVYMHGGGWILGNAGTLVVFRVGAVDAGKLVKELRPDLPPYDLTLLPNRTFWIRPLVNGESVEAFTGRTITIEEGRDGSI